MISGENAFIRPVSVLMLAKNKAKYLRTGAFSVVEGGQAELVLIEPGSHDNSRNVCEQIANEFPNLVKLVTSEDSSPADGLNNGLAKANGSIVGVLNADDIYLPGALNQVIDYFDRNPNIEVLLAGGFLINEISGNWKFVLPSKISRFSIGLSGHGSLTFFHQGMFYRKERFPNIEFNPHNKINWDKEFLIRLFQANAKIGYLKLPLAIFRINNDSLTYQGFSAQSIKENAQNFESMLGFRIRFPTAQVLGQLLRVFKALRLVAHTTAIHSKKYIMTTKKSSDE
jgi:glycosyltransferase involved in cell wall biosynthesis